MKIKCDRCKALTANETAKANTETRIDSFQARGYDDSMLVDGLGRLVKEHIALSRIACSCVYADQREFVSRLVIRE